jgi:FkbM family methyltransferase
MSSCIFTNDGDTTVALIDHPFSQTFASRNHHEVLFRQMHTYLMDTGVIKNNIIDLGAWIGDNTIPWAKRSGSVASLSVASLSVASLSVASLSVASLSVASLSVASLSVVYAIDPSKENCEFIQQMCDHNQLTNVKIFQTAVSNTMELLSTNDDMYHCTFVQGSEGRNKVNAITLDHLFNTGEIEHIGYIHLDVEGMEYKVILGAEQIIDTCRPIITFEQHLETDNYNLILEHLTNKNYVVYLIDEVLPGCRPDCRNSIAFPKETFEPNIVNNIHEYLKKEILLPFF